MRINQLPQTPNVGNQVPNDLWKWLIEIGNRIRTLIDQANTAFSPPAHKATHATGGSDALSPADIGALSAAGISANKKLFGNADGTAPEWSTGIKIGTFTRDTSLASGTQAITGVGFKPSHVIFLANTFNTPEASVGFDSGTIAYELDSYGAVVAGNWLIHSFGSIFLLQGDSIFYSGRISSFDTDGFTITWTKTGAKTGTGTIAYLACR